MIPRVPISTIWTARHNGKLLISGQTSVDGLSSCRPIVSTIPRSRMSLWLSRRPTLTRSQQREYRHHDMQGVHFFVQKLSFQPKPPTKHEQAHVLYVQRRHFKVCPNQISARNVNRTNNAATNIINIMMRFFSTSNHGSVRLGLSQKQGRDISLNTNAQESSKARRERTIEREKIADLKRAGPVVIGPSLSSESDWIERQGYTTGIMVQNSLTKQQWKKEPLVLLNKSVATW